MSISLKSKSINGKRTYASNIWKYYLMDFLGNLNFFSGILIPFFTEWGRISYSNAFTLQAIFVAFIFLLEVPTGAVADYLGRKHSVILGLFFNVIAISIYVSHPSFWVFALGEFVWALSIALMSGADEALVYDSLKEIEKENISKKVFGRSETFKMLGMFIAAPIGSYLVQFIGLRVVMFISAIPVFFGLLVAFTFKEPKSEFKSKDTKYFETLFSGLKYFRNHIVLKTLAFDTISISVLSFLIIWVYQPLLIELGMPILYFGFIHAGMVLAQILFLNSFSNLEFLFGSKKKYLMWSALITGLAYLLVGLANSITLILIGIMVVSGFGLTRGVLFSSYMNKHIESSNRATVLSTVSMIRRLVGGVMYIVVGYSIQYSIQYTIVGLGVFTIASALLSRTQEEYLLD